MAATDLFSQYLDPTAFNTPKGGGMQGGNNGSIIDQILSFSHGGLLDSIFGGDKPSWKSYIDANGNNVWANPSKKNPVPIATTPGASINPSKQYRDMANNIQAITDLLPQYSKAIAGQIIPQAQAQLAAAEATSPEYNKLMLEMYQRFGPQLNDVGNQISKQNALASAQRDKDVLAGPGKELIQQALENAKIYDPEYFKTRAVTSDKLNQLLGSIDLTSGLSGSERAEVERSQAQEGTRRGTFNAPSNLDTVSNAMQFGDKGFDRLQKNRNSLSTAIANASAALPTFKSGVDVFQVATGKSSGSNSGDNKFQGVNTTAYDNAASLGNGLLNNTVSTQQNNAQLALQNKLQSKDWADYLGQVTSSIGNLTSAAGGVAGMCWIARKAYGENNPRWKLWRHWLLNKAPTKITAFYIKYGKQIADNMTDKQSDDCRSIMDNILNKEYAHV